MSTRILDLMDDGETVFIPGVNCITCGRFVGHDGHIEVGHFEMSTEVAYASGECARCIQGGAS